LNEIDQQINGISFIVNGENECMSDDFKIFENDYLNDEENQLLSFLSNQFIKFVEFYYSRIVIYKNCVIDRFLILRL
jgi:hypothetical protein